MKQFLTLFIAIAVLFSVSGESHAMNQASGSSATLKSEITTEIVDHRSQMLREYLETHDSPLASEADAFVSIADKYELDWKLLASIAGLESSYGKRLPYNSHNAWGWGYNNGTVKHFDTWEDAIEEISKGLRERYLRDIEYSDPYIIGPTYAASPTWAQRVTYIMGSIEDYRLRNAKDTLTLAL